MYVSQVTLWATKACPLRKGGCSYGMNGSGQVNRVFAQASRPPPLTEDEKPLSHRLAMCRRC